MAGAVFGEVKVSLFLAGVVFGAVAMSLFVAGELSLLVAGAIFGEIWNDSRSAKCCIFQYKMLVVSGKSNLGCEAGCGLTVSCSDHGRNGLGTVLDRPRIVNDVSSVFTKFLARFRRSFFVAGAVFGEVGR